MSVVVVLAALWNVPRITWTSGVYVDLGTTVRQMEVGTPELRRVCPVFAGNRSLIFVNDTINGRPMFVDCPVTP